MLKKHPLTKAVVDYVSNRTGYVTHSQANRIITCSYLNVINCIEKYVNDKDRNRTKQHVHVWNSIDPQQMLDREMIRLDTFFIPIRYGQIRINAFSYVPLPTITAHPSAHEFLTVMIICPRIFRAQRIRYVQLRTLRIRYESLRIGRTDTEHLSAASAEYVNPSMT